MIVKIVYLLSLIVACFTFSAVHANDCVRPTSPPLSLCQEFQLIRDLVPEESINNLVQSHMSNDLRFRKAVQYMQSSEFKKTIAKLDATATFQSFLRPLVRARVNTTDINTVGKIFDCIFMPFIESRSSFRSENALETRSLDTFVQELARLINPDELIETLKTQIAENKQFAEFYKIVRDPSFRNKVMQGFTNRDVSRTIKILRHHQIDLSVMAESAFNILYLGPDV